MKFIYKCNCYYEIALVYLFISFIRTWENRMWTRNFINSAQVISSHCCCYSHCHLWQKSFHFTASKKWVTEFKYFALMGVCSLGGEAGGLEFPLIYLFFISCIVQKKIFYVFFEIFNSLVVQIFLMWIFVLTCLCLQLHCTQESWFRFLILNVM